LTKGLPNAIDSLFKVAAAWALSEVCAPEMRFGRMRLKIR
jgi:hypothetical protein